MIREELLHPLFVHIPIGLLSLYPLVLIASIFAKGEWKKNLSFVGHFLLFVGVGGFLTAIYLGEAALDIISGSICDLLAAYRHEDDAYRALAMFACCLGIDGYIMSKKLETNKFALSIQTLVSCIALYFLISTGHSGAVLVYEKGAAVKTAQCKKSE